MMGSAATETSIRGSPFRGLGYYAEADAEWFFGREPERRTIIGNLRAAQLTLLYAESGVGKSSLLRAGVVSRLREIAHRNAERGSPKFIPVVFSSWQDEPVEELIGEIEREANSFAAKGHTISLPRERLGTAIKAASEAVDATLLIILDQFEEHFGYRLARSSPERLAGDLAESIANPQLRANFLIAIREDAYARLGDLFAGQKINVYGNYLHLEYLDRAAARAAIERPIERFNATHSGDQRIELEPALTEAVLDEVRRGRLVLGQGVQDGAGSPGQSARPGDEIETPFLQLVMTRLWELEYGQGSRVLRKATLDDLGGAETIVRTHLDGALAGLGDEELEAATDIFHDLVTPSGAKIAHTSADLEKMTARPKNTVAAVLEKLDAARVVRPVEPAPGTGEERYEIFHDRLAAPLLDWIALRDNERLRREARAERRRANIFRALAIGSVLLFVLALTAVVFAEIQNGRANQQRRTAQSLQLAASAQATLGTDPELSALLALKGLRISDTDQAAQALRAALPQLRLLATLDAGGALMGAAFNPDGTEIVTASDDGKARIWSASTRKQIAVITEPGSASGAQQPGVPTHTRLASVAFSPDGKQIVTASSDGTARIWGASSHKQLGVLTEPGHSQLYSAAFSPDGKEIVTMSYDGTARIWSASSDTQLAVLTDPLGSGAGAANAAFSPDGKKIITVFPADPGIVRIWSASTHKQIGVLTKRNGGSPNSAAFSPDGREIVTAGSDDTARIWSAITHKQLVVVTEPGGGQGEQTSGGGVTSAAFSPDGTKIVTTGQDRTARVWSARTGKQLFVLADHTNSVQTAAFSPNGRMIVTASYDGSGKLWNAAPLEQLGVLAEPGNNQLFSAGFSPDGEQVVGAAGSETVGIWSASTYKQRAAIRIPAPGGGTRHIADFSPDGKEISTEGEDHRTAQGFIVIVGGGRTAEIWSTSSRKRVAVITAPGQAELGGATFSPDGSEIVSAMAGTGGIGIWDARSGKLLGVINEPSPAQTPGGFVDSASFSHDNKEIMGLDQDDGIAWVWSARSHKQLAMVIEPTGVTVISAAFSPNGKEIAIVSDDGTVRIWSVTSNQQLGVLTEPNNSHLNSAEFSADGKEIVTASDDGTARIWSASSYEQLTVIAEPFGRSVTNAAFNPNGKEIVTTSADGGARIWSTELAGPSHAIKRIAEMRVTRQLTASERRAYLAGS